nr:SUMF1/EgtB/PvdO family nonheme iron enzyme [Burkholderiales bacterium]
MRHKRCGMRCFSPSLGFLVAAFALVLPAATAQEKHGTGSEFQDCAECPVMVIVPTGRYSMLMPPIDQGRPYDEGENRLVIISKRFAVAKFEVTFKEWRACVADGQCAVAEDEGWGRGQRPVINISWSDAARYTKWLAEKTGKPYRLLTEAE